MTSKHRTTQERGRELPPQASEEDPPAAAIRARLAGLFLPLLGTQALIGMMEVTDAAMMRDLGGHAFAAGSFAVSVVVTARIASTAGLCVAGPLIASARARGAVAELRPLALSAGGCAVLLGLGAALGLSVLLLAWSPSSLPEDTVRQSVRFARVLALGLPFALLFSVARHLLSGLGRPARLLRPMFLAVPLNAALNLVLGRGIGAMHGLGLDGIAWSTVLVEALLAALAWSDLARHLPRPEAISKNDGRSTREHMLFLLRAGAPLSLAAGLEVGVFQLSGLVVAQTGVDALSAHQALLTVAGYAACIPVALTTACSILVAEHVALGRPPRSALLAAAVVGASLAVGLALVVLLSGGHLVALFVARGSPPWVLAVGLAPWLAVLLFADTLQGAVGGVLRGFQDTSFLGKAAVVCLGLGAAGGLLAAYRLGGGVRAVWWVLAGALGLLLVACGRRLLGISTRGVARSSLLPNPGAFHPGEPRRNR